MGYSITLDNSELSFIVIEGDAAYFEFTSEDGISFEIGSDLQGICITRVVCEDITNEFLEV